ncbi:phosphotransferase [Colletotrichum paranaense]|uniref:Phosphotransferase n=1 Tax=Colletotrichum paranaense TaxID=1914294 RepID=A0ABQ9SFX4_9PEZI|nr:phosphotransferase [Colletotrichum paranaense]KAK1535612.1 phosphotransferase [Colletotrichum paranaense]
MADESTSDRVLREVKAELAGTPYSLESARLLSGGTTNFIFHVKLLEPLLDGTAEVAVKHGEGFVAQSPDFELPTSRCRIEESCLKDLSALSPHTGEKITVATPKLFYFNEETNTQVQAYQPSPLSLKNYAIEYFAASTLEAPTLETSTLESVKSLSLEIGTAVGAWLRSFHDWSNSEHQLKFRDIAAGNKEMQTLKRWMNYERLPISIKRFPDILGGCNDIFADIVDSVKEEMVNEQALQVIHGDFWTGNILLEGKPWDDEHSCLLVVDWEMCQLAVKPLDLGQMIAELYELKLYKDMEAGVWLIQGFVNGYGAVDDDFAFRTLLHVAVHLIGFGTTVQGWGSQDQARAVATEGRDILKNAWAKDRGFFEKHPLGCVFS